MCMSRCPDKCQEARKEIHRQACFGYLFTLLNTLLRRIKRLNPLVNAHLTVTADAAREQARAAEALAMRGEAHGLLDGLPYTLKDLEPTAGVRTTYGSRWFEHHVPTEDGAVATRLKAAGGILLGKTNTPHFGYKDMCDNLIGPPCRNPWKLDRTSGASSGGALRGLRPQALLWARPVARGAGIGQVVGRRLPFPWPRCNHLHELADRWTARRVSGHVSRAES